MKNVSLYKIINRELIFVKNLSIEENINYDSWLYKNGFDKTYTIRNGIVTNPSEHELKIIHNYVKELKIQGKLPNILEIMI